MIHWIRYTLLINNQAVQDFTYILSLHGDEVTNEQLEERIKNNYRNISKIPVSSVKINSLRSFVVQ